jgi:50S ribosomal subunit-associated GTPase HflX
MGDPMTATPDPCGVTMTPAVKAVLARIGTSKNQMIVVINKDENH